MLVTLESSSGGLQQPYSLYCYTGGKPFDPAKPSVVMVHGVLNDHSVWYWQSRHLAHQVWNVLALDLPGHGKSGGIPPASVEDGAAGVIDLLNALNINKAALVGHSFGSLICLEAAAQHPDRVSHLALLGTASPMRVSAALLQASVDAPEQAIAMVNQFSHAMLALVPNAQAGGMWTYGASRALMRKTLASNRSVNLFFTGFKACDSYTKGENAMAKVDCPTLFVLGAHDQMTPAKAARPLIDKAMKAQTAIVNAGHAMLSEVPDDVLSALKGLLRVGR
jgi:pimeloyl-ACP methyl ester carboxylesterase